MSSMPNNSAGTELPSSAGDMNPIHPLAPEESKESKIASEQGTIDPRLLMLHGSPSDHLASSVSASPSYLTPPFTPSLRWRVQQAAGGNDTGPSQAHQPDQSVDEGTTGLEATTGLESTTGMEAMAPGLQHSGVLAASNHAQSFEDMMREIIDTVHGIDVVPFSSPAEQGQLPGLGLGLGSGPQAVAGSTAQGTPNTDWALLTSSAPNHLPNAHGMSGAQGPVFTNAAFDPNANAAFIPNANAAFIPNAAFNSNAAYNVAFNATPAFHPNAGVQANAGFDPNAAFQQSPGFQHPHGFQPTGTFQPTPGIQPTPGFGPTPPGKPNAGGKTNAGVKTHAGGKANAGGKSTAGASGKASSSRAASTAKLGPYVVTYSQLQDLYPQLDTLLVVMHLAKQKNGPGRPPTDGILSVREIKELTEETKKKREKEKNEDKDEGKGKDKDQDSDKDKGKGKGKETEGGS